MEDPDDAGAREVRGGGDDRRLTIPAEDRLVLHRDLATPTSLSVAGVSDGRGEVELEVAVVDGAARRGYYGRPRFLFYFILLK